MKAKKKAPAKKKPAKKTVRKSAQKKKPAKKAPIKRSVSNPKKDRKLYTKELAFVNLILEGEKDGPAYKKAYNSKGNETTCRKEGHTVRSRWPVYLAIEKGQAEAAKRSEITADTLIVELEEARQVGKSEGSGAAMTGATMGKARLLGLDKKVLIIENADKLTPWSEIIAGIDSGEA